MNAETFLGFATAAAQYGLTSVLVRPLRMVGGIVMQVVVEEHHVDDLEITDHPVEQGAVISDHAYKRPAELRIVGGWSDSPTVPDLFQGVVAAPGATVSGVQALINGNGVGQAKAMYARMLDLQQKREPLDVYTGKRVYRDMLIKGLQATTDRDHENAVLLTMTLRQVIMVSTRLVSLQVPAARQADPASTAAPVDVGPKQLVPSNRYDAGAGRGQVNPPVVTP